MSSNRIVPEANQIPAECERGKFWKVDNEYLSSIGYPVSSGRGKYAVLTYDISESTTGSTPGEVATPNVIQLGAIAESTTPTPVADGATVALWADLYGRLVTFGDNLALNAKDVNQINQATLNRLGPITQTQMTATGASAAVDVSNYHNFTIHLQVGAVSGSNSVEVEHSLDGTNFIAIYTHTITTNDDIEVAISQQAYIYLRVSITTHDGTATITPIIYAGN